MTFSEIFLAISRTALDVQRHDGSMPAGTNGLYGDKETPVRNTSHWILTFLKAHALSGESAFLNAARAATEYLLHDTTHRTNFTFCHRQSKTKDSCNGVIGAAWNIEALLAAYRTFSDERCLELAKTLVAVHPFDATKGLWQRREANGEVRSIDTTFNHQLWFGAAVAMVARCGDTRASEQAEQFLAKLPGNYQASAKGRIFHYVALPKTRFGEFVRRSLKSTHRQHMVSKEIGYHAFALYGFALLYEQFPMARIFSEKPFRTALRYSYSDEFQRGIVDSKYGYPYNPPGFELPYIYEVFQKDGASMGSYLQEQLNRCLESATWTLSLGTDDPTTMTARIYEATRLPRICFEQECLLPLPNNRQQVRA